ncbi:glutamate synthase-related protein [Sphingomonas panacisoli]|uniref:glutamate synthase-related protein n=1 Tax=Sphingomonas panacisoli TaxID=1813879 RepID=UPI0023D907C8|nr:glutamate synthase-related protein [Sphingomonas panacisoli]
MPTSSWSPGTMAVPAEPADQHQICRHAVGNGALSEVNQTLTLNGLRGRIELRTDGGLKTGARHRHRCYPGRRGIRYRHAQPLSRWAASLVQQCHSNTCPVGVCRRDPTLRFDGFTGSPEKVINLMAFIAEEVRDILACGWASTAASTK